MIHLPRPHHRTHALAAILAALALAALVACTGCSNQVSDYGAYNDSIRGTCEATGSISHTTLNRHGWTSDCYQALPE